MARLGLIAALAVVAVAASGTARAENYFVSVNPVRKVEGFDKIRVSKAALGGAEIRLWFNTAIDPDCNVHPPGTTLSVLKPPEHGTARVSDDPFFAAFPPNNPRAACNNQKIPGHQAFYAANAGYAGRDRVVLQASTPDGHVREITVDIDVR